eukprot:166469_1
MSNTQKYPLVANDAESTTTNVYGATTPKTGSIPMTDDDDKYAEDFKDHDDSEMFDYDMGYDMDFISFKINKINKTKIKLKDDDLNEMYPHLNFELKIDDKQIYKGYGLCHEEYVDENDEIQQISGFCRIMIDEDHDVNLPKSIKYRFGTNKEWSETISYPPDTTNGWNYTEQKMVCKEIKEHKKYAKDELEIYVEKITIYHSDAFPMAEQAKQLLKGDVDDWKKVDALFKVKFDIYGAHQLKKTNLVVCTNMHDMQIYYDESKYVKDMDPVYGVKNETVNNSATFCSVGVQTLFERDHSFDYQNITKPLYICSRYHWIKDECLYGQDE